MIENKMDTARKILDTRQISIPGLTPVEIVKLLASLPIEQIERICYRLGVRE
jgi:hypothetical protein